MSKRPSCHSSTIIGRPIFIFFLIFYRHMRRHLNQYSNKHDYRHESELWLKSKCESASSSTGLFVCMIPRRNTPGIDTNNGGYRRFSFNGKKVLCHVFIYETNVGPRNKKLDVSHRCGVKACCNPQHLVQESRRQNKSRDNCPGFITVNGETVKLCRHDPPCCKESDIPHKF